MKCDTCKYTIWGYKRIPDSIVRNYYIDGCKKSKKLDEGQYLKLLASNVEECPFYVRMDKYNK